MRTNKKILCALLVFFSLVCAFIFFAQTAVAYKIEIGLPNLPATTDVTDPGEYIKYFFVFGLLLCGFLAVAAIVFGGITYMLAGTVTSVEKAKSIIFGAITGIVLLLCSYLLLATIDPTLTNLSPFKPPATGNIPQQRTPQPTQQYAQPNSPECNNPATCTVERCGPGAISGVGRCVSGEIWNTGQVFGQTCACVSP